jgi:predicted RNase H-like HicB family nuclease
MEILPNFHQVDGVNENCYLVVRENGLALVDTGLPGNKNTIERYVRDQLRRSLSDIHTIVLSHFHLDHIGNLSSLQAASGATVAIHEADAPYFTGEKPSPVYTGMRGFLLRVVSLVMRVGTIQSVDRRGITLSSQTIVKGVDVFPAGGGRMLHYAIGIFYSEDDKGYIALVPELPGCSAFGRTEEEALREVKIAMQLWIATAKMQGRRVPRPIGKELLQLILDERDRPAATA